MTAESITRVIHEHEYDRAEPKLRVKLTKASTKDGQYGWDISYEGDDITSVLAEIETADKRLRAMTGAA